NLRKMYRSLFFYIAGLAMAVSLISSCSKEDYSPLQDTCLMQKNAAFRMGKWKLIVVDSVDFKMNWFINFVTDSLYIREHHSSLYSKFDTAEYRFIDCNT